MHEFLLHLGFNNQQHLAQVDVPGQDWGLQIRESLLTLNLRGLWWISFP